MATKAAESKLKPRLPRNAEEALRVFLELVISEPEKAPKRQRDQRDNRMQVIGFNMAQEQLRNILSQVEGDTGQAFRARELAGVRVDGQEQPMEIGDGRVWLG